MAHMAKTVGVRELRRDLSGYLRRVADGESFTVTSRGQEIARLAPAPGRSDATGRLIADRQATSPRVDLLELEPPAPYDGPPLSVALDDVRADR